MHLPRAKNAVAGFYAAFPCPRLPQLQVVGEAWLAPSNDIRDHAHEVWEVYLQLAGDADWHDDQGGTTLSPGDAYLAGPGVRHHLGRVRGARHQFIFAIVDFDAWVAARLPILREGLQRARRSGLIHGPAEVLREPLRLLAASLSRQRAHRDVVVATALDAVCLATVEWATGSHHVPLRPEHPGVALVRERIDAAPGRSWTLAELAQDTGLTPKHLCTIFGQQVGQTPHQYLLAVRLEGIQRALVQTDLSITQLAVDFGFASSQHLSRLFTARVGISARDYRRRQGVLPQRPPVGGALEA